MIAKCRMVLYTLSAEDAEKINRLRTTGVSIAERLAMVISGAPGEVVGERRAFSAWPKGAQAHIGNHALEGDQLPAVVVYVGVKPTLPGEPLVNLQVFLDGNDTYWVQHVPEGNEPGCWMWPPKVEAP